MQQNWDKTFQPSVEVEVTKVKFYNRYGIELVGDLYKPHKFEGQLAGLAICGPFGAVKEQASGLYAQEMAKRGFIALTFDPSFTGESGGHPRGVASPDINTEDFQAAIDFLSVQDQVDAQRLGIIGICGFGGLALNAAVLDTRVKVTICVTMYDMSRVITKGYFDSEDTWEARYQKKLNLNNQRLEDFKKGTYAKAGGVIDPLPQDAPDFVKDYYAYYKTKRGYHPRSLNSNEGWNVTGTMSFLNMPILSYVSEIRSAVLLVHGEKAHSCYFSKDVFSRLVGQNKELCLLKNVVHTDLYDQLDLIPFTKITEFLRTYLDE